MAHPDLVVIGGGLHGLSAALHAARRGAKVALLEAHWVGRHASSATAAGVRTLGRAYEEMPISVEAMGMWHRIQEIVGDDCGFYAGGQIKVAETDAQLEVLSQRQAGTVARGYSNEDIIDARTLLDLVPGLSPHCKGALYAKSDGAADPHRTIRAFLRSCREASVAIHEGESVKAIQREGACWRIETATSSYQATQIVNCGGAWAAQIAHMIGEEIPLGYKASMMIATERLEPFLKQVISVVGRPLSFKQSSQGTLVIGGGLQGYADVEAQHSRVNFHELSKGTRTATDLFPCVRDVRIARTWTGIEAKTRDLLPVIGQSDNAEGFWHAFGFSGHGFQLVPVVGSIIADLVTTGSTARPIAAFAARRLKATSLKEERTSAEALEPPASAPTALRPVAQLS
jgi:sarcosine oxidase subunit beta